MEYLKIGNLQMKISLNDIINLLIIIHTTDTQLLEYIVMNHGNLV